MIESTITVTIPASWLEDGRIGQEELREALILGLTQLRQQQAARAAADRIAHALLSIRLIDHLSATLAPEDESHVERQAPPVLVGPPASEILIAQRRGG
jgi:hypothetical protein